MIIAIVFLLVGAFASGIIMSALNGAADVAGDAMEATGEAMEKTGKAMQK